MLKNIEHIHYFNSLTPNQNNRIFAIDVTTRCIVCAMMCVERQGSSVLCAVRRPINGLCNCLYSIASHPVPVFCLWAPLTPIIILSVNKLYVKLFFYKFKHTNRSDFIKTKCYVNKNPNNKHTCDLLDC